MLFAMKKLLVLGGGGFIGLNFLRHILDDLQWGKSYEISVVDKLTYAANPFDLYGLAEKHNFRVHCADICNQGDISRIFGNPNIVVNFAAESHVDTSIDSPSLFANTNYIGTSHLLELSVQRGVSRFIQISTDEVYGDLEWGEATEEHALRPSSPYSASKAAGDLLALAFARTYGLGVVITRTCNNFGPGQHSEKFIPQAIAKISANMPVPIYGDGDQIREWIDVRDNVTALARLLNDGKDGEIYNIGSGVRMTNNQIVQKLFEAAGRGSAIYVEDRPGHDRRYAIDSRKVDQLLGDRNLRSVEDYFASIF